jgi:hypothetical protein
MIKLKIHRIKRKENNRFKIFKVPRTKTLSKILKRKAKRAAKNLKRKHLIKLNRLSGIHYKLRKKIFKNVRLIKSFTKIFTTKILDRKKISKIFRKYFLSSPSQSELIIEINLRIFT